MRLPAILALVLVFILTAGCDGPATSPPSDRDRHGRPIRQAPALEVETFPRKSPISVVGFGVGSLWVIDYGDYRCDDTPGTASSGGSPWTLASCVGPEKVSLQRVDPGSLEVLASIPLRNTDGVDLAFGAGAVWISYEDHLHPSKSGVLRLDPKTNEVTDRIPIKSPSYITFGEDAVWISSYGGTVTKIDPDSRKVVARVDLGHNGIGEVAAGEGSVWVASNDTLQNVDERAWEDLFENGKYPETGHPERNTLLRLDPDTGEVVARIPVARTEVEGGAASVAVDEGSGAVWVTSNNGRLLHVDPAKNQVVANLPLGDYAYDLQAGYGSVWAQVELDTDEPGWTAGIARVSTDDNAVSGRADVPDASGLAVGDGALWVGSSAIEEGKGALVRITP
jgi:hypothetical protein